MVGDGVRKYKTNDTDYAHVHVDTKGHAEVILNDENGYDTEWIEVPFIWECTYSECLGGTPILLPLWVCIA